MEGNLTLIIIALIALSRLLGALFKSKQGGRRQQDQLGRPQSVPPPFKQEDVFPFKEPFSSPPGVSPGGQGQPDFLEQSFTPPITEKIDPWAFDRVETSPAAGKSSEWGMELPERGSISAVGTPGKINRGSLFKYSPKVAGLPGPPQKDILAIARKGASTEKSSAVFSGLKRNLTEKDQLVSAFIVHEILEPPLALKRKRRT